GYIVGHVDQVLRAPVGCDHDLLQAVALIIGKHLRRDAERQSDCRGERSSRGLAGRWTGRQALLIHRQSPWVSYISISINITGAPKNSTSPAVRPCLSMIAMPTTLLIGMGAATSG